MKKTTKVEETEDKTKAITEMRMCFQSICHLEATIVEQGCEIPHALATQHNRFAEHITNMCLGVVGE